MAVIKHHKHVAALPGTLEANSVYYVRTGAGFDIYVTNDSGLVVAYPLNTQDEWPGLGIGQIWQDKTSSRAFGVSYENDTDRPIMVVVMCTALTPGVQILVDGVVVAISRTQISSTTTTCSVCAVVPPGSEYEAANVINGTMSRWTELR